MPEMEGFQATEEVRLSERANAITFRREATVQRAPSAMTDHDLPISSRDAEGERSRSAGAIKRD